jgi:hypothetical protein
MKWSEWAQMAQRAWRARDLEEKGGSSLGWKRLKVLEDSTPMSQKQDSEGLRVLSPLGFHLSSRGALNLASPRRRLVLRRQEGG